MTRRAEDVLTDWAKAVNSKNLEGLLALYDEKSVLVPTFSNEMRKTPEAVKAYFVELCGREQLSITIHEKTVIFQTVQYEVYAVAGPYTWRFVAEGALREFEARFSFVFDLTLAKPILHHHSSLAPKT